MRTGLYKKNLADFSKEIEIARFIIRNPYPELELKTIALCCFVLFKPVKFCIWVP